MTKTFEEELRKNMSQLGLPFSTYSFTSEAILAAHQAEMDGVVEEVIGKTQAEEVFDDTGEEYPIPGASERNGLRYDQRARYKAIKEK